MNRVLVWPGVEPGLAEISLGPKLAVNRTTVWRGFEAGLAEFTRAVNRTTVWREVEPGLAENTLPDLVWWVRRFTQGQEGLGLTGSNQGCSRTYTRGRPGGLKGRRGKASASSRVISAKQRSTPSLAVTLIGSKCPARVISAKPNLEPRHTVILFTARVNLARSAQDPCHSVTLLTDPESDHRVGPPAGQALTPI